MQRIASSGVGVGGGGGLDVFPVEGGVATRTCVACPSQSRGLLYIRGGIFPTSISLYKKRGGETQGSAMALERASKLGLEFYTHCGIEGIIHSI